MRQVDYFQAYYYQFIINFFFFGIKNYSTYYNTNMTN